MNRFIVLFALCGTGLLLTPGAASAQFGLPFGGPFYNRGFTPTPFNPFIGPVQNPFYFIPRYRYTEGFQFVGPTLHGYTRIGFSNTAYTTMSPAAFHAVYNLPYAQSGSYMTGSPSVRADLVRSAQRDLAIAQRQASSLSANAVISGQWNYEKRNQPQAPATSDVVLPDPLLQALEPADREMITSGVALNALLKEIAVLEGKGASGPSAYIAPLLWSDIRFGGTPNGELLNFARMGSNLELPAAFEDQELAQLSKEFAKDFAAIAVMLQAGKAPESAKVTRAEQSFQLLSDAASPIITNLSFDDAAAARRFLNRMASALKALKAGSVSSLIDPRWATEGLTTSELTRHMTRQKVQFGPAPRRGEEAYTTMHQNLSTYLFVLRQANK